MASVAAILGAAGIGAAAQNAGSFIDWGVNSWLNQQQQEMALQRMSSEQQFNALEAQKSRDWQERMASTNYQRAIADMEQAGLNPASLVGSSPSGALAPNAANASSGVGSVPGSHFRGQGSGLASMMSSAIQGMIAKDRDAAKFLADEFRDNARHAHKMEENYERIEYNTLKNEMLNAEKHGYRMEELREKMRHLTDVEAFKYSYGHKSYPYNK